MRANKDGIEQRLLNMATDAGLPMVMRERMANSRRALEASEYAREMGKHDSFHKIMFRKYYGEGQDMYDWDVIRAAAKEADLDPDEMQTRTERGDYTDTVTETIQHAGALGIRGVPAYIIDEKYLISGAQPYDVFDRVMREHVGVEPKK